MPNHNYYTVLGVLPNADDVVIKAAYRALAQRYHPDKWAGDPKEAHRRMSEINAAFEVLGDPARRKNYDNSCGGQENDAYNQDSESHDEAFSAALKSLEQRWGVACAIFPDLNTIRTKLAKTSTSLAFAFVTIILEKKLFNQRASLADEMEQVFLSRYFGNNPRINNFAKTLIEDGHKDALRYLNELVDVLGSDVDSSLLINRVEEKFGCTETRQKKQEKLDKQNAIDKLKNKVKQSGYYDEAEMLAKLCGYQVYMLGGGFFAPSKVEIIDPDRNKFRFDDVNSFIVWITRNLCN